MGQKTMNKKNVAREVIFSFLAPQEGELLSLLLSGKLGLSRNTIKQKLRDRCVTVNGIPCSQFDAIVPGEGLVEVHSLGFSPKLNHPLVREVYSDEFFFVVYKEAGIPTVSVSKEAERTLFRLVAKHLKDYNPREKIFLLNRLDKDTAGFVVLARQRELQQQILNDWKIFMSENVFSAVVKGSLSLEQGFLEQVETEKTQLKGTKAGKLGGKKAPFKAKYKVIGKSAGYLSKLEISLQTRNNAIRSSLAAMGCPLVGDRRCKDALMGTGTLALRATKIRFCNPITQKVLLFEEPIPDAMDKLLQMRLTRAQKASFGTPKFGD